MILNSTPVQLRPRIIKAQESLFLVIFCWVSLVGYLGLFAHPAYAQTTPTEVEIIPMLECVKWLPAENKYEAVFGYNNPSKTDVSVPPEKSSISCTSADIVPGAFATFKPGRVFSAFSVKFDCSELTWTVTGPSGKPKSVTASGSSEACATGGSISPNGKVASPLKINSKIGAELSILPNFGTISTDEIYQIEVDNVEFVFIKLIASTGQTSALLSDVTALGFKNAKVAGLQITGWLPVSQLLDLNNLVNLNLALPVFTPISNGGAVTSQGDKAQRTNLTRAAFGVQGEGIKIGVLSDSYNARLGNKALLDVLQGDLPGVGNLINPLPVQILKDLPASSGLGTDEGRAMLQIIHDIAPKASLAFRTGFDGPLDLAQGIRELKLAGCNIIVDDITYIDDPYFQDGLVAQAVDEVVGQGVTYFSAAGNFGDKSYQGVFQPKTLSDGRVVHAFSGTDHLQRLFLPEGSYTLGLQWISNLPQDLDFYLTDDSGNIIIGYNRSSTFPFEGMAFEVSAGGAVANIMIVNASGEIDPSTLFKYIIFRGNAAISEYRAGSSTITGHANAAGAIAVGAVLFENTPAYNKVPTIASFSSRGGTAILRDVTGNPVNLTRNKPDFAAPNGVNTTVDFGSTYVDGDVFPNFFGTSASAPHAAAAAALLQEAHKKYSGPTLSPEAVRTSFANTALDMGPSGFDVASGHGFIRPDVAISEFANPTPLLISLTIPEDTIAGKPIIINGHYFQNSAVGSVSKIKFGGEYIPTTFISETQLQAVIPNFTGNPAIEVCNPSKSILGGDGGCSKPLYLFPKKVITVTAHNFTKNYGDAMPAFTSSVSDVTSTLTQTDIQYTTLATDLSDVGAYVVTPFIVPGHLLLAQPDKYEFVFEPGTLLIEKIALEIRANDVAITEGAPLTGFSYSYHFPDPVQNTEDRLALLRSNILQNHKASMTNKVALVEESLLLSTSSISNRSFLTTELAETNALRVLNSTFVLNVSSRLLNELNLDALNATFLLNSTYLLNALRVMNSTRLLNSLRLMNSTRLLNSNTIGELSNEKAVLILNENDYVLSKLYSINLITGYTLGTHLWAPAALLSNNFNITYGAPANFFVNPIGVGAKAVKPILECVQKSSRPGFFIAHFGYDNPNPTAVGLPVGSENLLVYEGASGVCFINGTSIPTVFKPGKNYGFSVEFDGSKLTWNLSSYQGMKKTSVASSASSTSSRCKTIREITIPCASPTLSTTLVNSMQEDNGTGGKEAMVYPNPVDHVLTLDLGGIAEPEVTISFSDALGKESMKKQTVKNQGIPLQLSTTDLKPGLYVMKLEYGNALKLIKIIKR